LSNGFGSNSSHGWTAFEEDEDGGLCAWLEVRRLHDKRIGGVSSRRRKQSVASKKRRERDSAEAWPSW